MTVHRRAVLLVASGAVAACVLTACGSSGGSGATATSPSTGSTPPPAASTSASAAVSAVGSSAPTGAATGQSVSAKLTEFAIALSTKTLKAGTYTVHVTNAGSITHALTVDGPGVKDKGTGDLAPGSSATLTVTLEPGTYDVYCPVGNHKMEGMDDTVTVG